ncbi:MAG: hypothetical protein WDO14_24575 [Bacteroidota bacterium]
MHRISCIVLFVIVGCFAVQAQLIDSHGEEVTPFYISFDTPLQTSVAEIRGEFLNISYRDAIGESETITLSITDSKRKFVKKLQLVKQFGQNYFNMKLTDYGIDFVEGHSYVCRLTNEKAESRERAIRYVEKDKKPITASILVDPKYLSCEVTDGSNLIDFYSQISGGTAPYKVNWYIMNANRTQFLYQPTYAVLQSATLSSSVQVDKDPVYFVLLQVTDNCGSEQIASVQIICEQNEKKVNTLFFQKLNDALPPNTVEPSAK